MAIEDPGLHEQEANIDPDAEPELTPEGHPVNDEIQVEDFVKGIDLTENPEEIHAQDHPTPNHPTGRLGP